MQKKERKALIVSHAPHADQNGSLDALNEHLADGWRVTGQSAMSSAGADTHGDGPHFAALVFLERDEEQKSVAGFGFGTPPGRDA